MTPLNAYLEDRTSTVTANGVVLSGGGAHQLVASYSGDDTYSPAISAPVSIGNTTGIPVLHPSPKVYTSVQTVTVTDATPGAKIFLHPRRVHADCRSDAVHIAGAGNRRDSDQGDRFLTERLTKRGDY